nr:hydrogenase maturation protease [Myxococcota bacterium]
MRRVIGIGSPHGDDAAGLLVARHLDATDCPGVQVVECGRPVPDLLDALEGAEAALLVDAVRAGGDAGALRRLDPGQLARAEASSSHGLGVAHALALHRALGRHEVPLACL